ncbi:MAG: gliding motility-associated C-terminal domain-containing protein [Bacteroidota bacterium]
MKYLFFLLSFAIISRSQAQCFEIQSILVDACAGSLEGQNEMVTFQVGSLPLNTANLSVSWPNNSWLGLAQNAGTASDIATVNATIIGCGFLKEPVAGVLPANSKVLLITSTSWSPLAQSFANLTDTLYVIFQASGNTSGHFANYASGGGTRTLTMNFSLPVGCSDVATYDRALLVTQSGSIGAQDGGAVEFTPAGVATYVNHGCQAPFIPLTVDAGVNKTVCINGAQSFTAIASGAYSSVHWSLGAGANGSFAPTNSLTTTYTSVAGDNGTIKLYCTLIKSCGTQTTSVKDSVNLTITPLPTVTVSPTSVSICSGQSAIVQANTNTAVAYTWSTGVNTNTASVSAAGIYTVNVSNACGSSSATVSAVLSAAPSVSIASSSPSLCPSGQTAVLSLSGNTGAYLWSNGTTTSTTSISSPGIYTATVTTASCGTATASISVGTIPSPTIAISAPTNSICSGGSIVLTANSNTTNYLWTGGVTTQTVSVNSYSTVVTTTNVCGSAQATFTLDIYPLPTAAITPNQVTLCSGQTASLQTTSNAVVSYTWSTGAHTSSVQVSTAGVYTVNVSNNCGNAMATATVTIGAGVPTLTIVPTSTLLCTGQTATLSLTGSTGTYNWSNGATTATTTVNSFGVYSATVTNSCGQATALVQITALPVPTISIVPASGILCPGTNVILTATSNVNNYAWSTGATTNTISTSLPGVYSVTVSNQCGTVITSANVSAFNLDPVVLTASSTTLCPNQTATLTASGGSISGSGNPATYTWSNNSVTGPVNTTTGGTITVSATNACGTYTQSIIVTVHDVHAGLTANPVSGTKPLVVTFTNTSVGGNSYSWNFGNGNTATGVTVPSQTYNTAGDYTASIQVSNGSCTDIASVVIHVLNEEPGLIIPNVFTPNNDHVNDLFKVTASNLTDFNAVIFDRWGLQLFTWNDILQGWDGKVNGHDCTEGTYFYIIAAKDYNNTNIKKQGTVNLFR